MRALHSVEGIDKPRPSSERNFSVFHSVAGSFELIGKDAIDLLQRISTNDVLQAGEQSACETVLTNEKGRIVEFLTVLRIDGRVFVVPASLQSRNAKDWIERFVITEDVRFDVPEIPCRLVSIIGPGAGRAIRDVFEGDVPVGARVAKQWVVGTLYLAWRNPAWRDVDCFNILVEEGDLDNGPLGMLLSGPGAPITDYERLRIVHGVPAMGKELTLDVNPLEAGLRRCVSFTKGCYIGQEVIARIDSYDKLQKTIAAFEVLSENPVLPGVLEADGNEVGWTTSHCLDTQHRRQFALGYLRVSSDGKALSLRDDSGRVLCGAIKRKLPEQLTQIQL
jgi:folate-binding protein YgfZ